MEAKVQKENDAIDIMNAQNDNCVESTNRLYNVDRKNEPDEDKMRRAVLNGTVPTWITDT